MNRYVKILLCITAIIIISILFCLLYNGENIINSPKIVIDDNTEAVMTNQQEFNWLVLLNFPVLPSPTPSEESEIPTDILEQNWNVTKCHAEESELFLWNTLMKYLNNEKVVAGIMGYFFRESGFRSDAIHGWHERDIWEKCDSSAEYTALIDVGLEDGTTKEIFINDQHHKYGGYGLGQWYAPYYLNELYEFACNWNTSIGDAEMQCAFMAWSIQNQTPQLWEQIKDEDNIYTIGRKVAVLYDGASEIGQGIMIEKAAEYYKKYGTGN